MKKLITLLLMMGAFATSFAQYDRRDDRRDDQAWNNRNDQSWNRNGGYYNYSVVERDREIAMINRTYERKINAVERDWFMNRRRKREIIQNLEFQKAQEIRMVYAKFSNNRNHGYDRRYDRRNNW